MKDRIRMTCALISLVLLSISCNLSQKTSLQNTNNWDIVLLQKGVVWKQWSGNYQLFNSNQTINVVDVDLNRANIKLDWVNSKDKFQPVDKLIDGENALVAINGTYPDRDKEGKWGSFFKRNDSILCSGLHYFAWIDVSRPWKRPY